DKDGYLHFYQRINRMAKISGFNVYLSNVEEIAMEYPAVKEAVAVAVDAPVVDKKVVLYVELHNQDADTEAVIKGINDICRDNLPEYSLPSQIVIKAIPHTPMGKPDYRTLEKGE
ncbi:MAG: acyl--CoA ligase, partial [Clostridia bacterium]|nr:acyl--CoA ligase [Clostridia bacterium]